MTSTPETTPKMSAYAVFTRNSLKKVTKDTVNVVEKTPVNTVESFKEMSPESCSDAEQTHAETILKIEGTKKSDAAESNPITSKRKFLHDQNMNGTTNQEVIVPKIKKMKDKGEKEENTKAMEEAFTIEEFKDEENSVVNGNSESRIFSPSTSANLDIPKKPQFFPCGNEVAEQSFRWLLLPFKPDLFFEKKFEKMPLYIKRKNLNFYEGLFSSKEFDTIMRENHLSYDTHIDILSYVDGKRKPVRNDTLVYPDFVWNAYKEGNTIRMRNPHTYNKSLWKLCSLLQEYFSSYVGANMYLTPADSQGFPPHYDDIDAFILQIEGKKLWRLYKPRTEKEVLVRYSSCDFNEEEIGAPIMEVELSAGDLLYFPRGFIHQAKTVEGVHSLHLTISTNQLNTWGDMLQSGLSHALDKAIENNVEFRKSLPKDYINHVGSSYSDCDSSERQALESKAMSLAQEAMKYFSVDYASDIHSLNFIHGCMPPFFNKREKDCSIHGNGTHFQNGFAVKVSDITPETKIRWIRKRAVRLIIDENGIRLFHTLENTKNHKEGEALFLEVDDDVVPAINRLFQIHPEYIKVKDLPMDIMETKMDLAQQLYDHGLLVTHKPLPLDESENVME